MWVYILIFVLLILLIIYVIFESRGYRTVTYNINSEDYKGAPLRFVFLADLHNVVYKPDNKPLLDTIDELKPDFIVFGGDMVTSGWDISFDYSKTLEFISALTKKYSVYYAPGNHEEKFDWERYRFPTQYDDLIKALSEYGVNYLDNEEILIPEHNLRIYGLRLSHKYYAKFKKMYLEDDYLSNIFGQVDPENFSVLIAHNPEFFDTYSKWGANLVLSGHVHGGIVSLPFIGGIIAPGIKLFPQYDAGLFYKNDSLMVLTRGIGYHCIPVRIRNKAEVVCINLQGDCDES